MHFATAEPVGSHDRFCLDHMWQISPLVNELSCSVNVPKLYIQSLEKQAYIMIDFYSNAGRHWTAVRKRAMQYLLQLVIMIADLSCACMLYALHACGVRQFLALHASLRVQTMRA